MYFNTKAVNSRSIRSRASLEFLEEMKNTKMNDNLNMGTSLSMAAEHSLVTHPVGYHWDHFSKRGSGDVIENKICLVNVQKSNSHNQYALGRGGCGPGRFVFAILDWGSGLNNKTSKIDANVIAHNWSGYLDSITL